LHVLPYVKDRTRQSLFKELDGIMRARLRVTPKQYEMLLKQTEHVLRLLGVDGFQEWCAIQEQRKERKLIRELRRVIERQRVRMYGKDQAVAISKEKAHLREMNGCESANQPRSVNAIKSRLFGLD
jgi:hypothetical protein